MYDAIIVGAGTAGLTSAIYLRRANKSVLVIEKNVVGGQIINTLSIENYPGKYHVSGFDYANDLYTQAKDLGAQFVFENVVKVTKDNKFCVVTTNNTYECSSLIIATGTKNKNLGVEGEENYIGKGLSYCATCDGAFYKDKIVAVVGGGNTAIEDAIYLSDIAKKVYLIHRRDAFRAEDVSVDLLKNKENVEFVLNSKVVKINGDNKIESIDVNTNETINNILVDGLFVAVGRTPNNEFVENLVSVDDTGYIISNEECTTNVDGLFVAGDNRVKNLRQLVTAASDGAIAANNAINYINRRNNNV